MRYFVGILVFVFCKVTGNSTEAGRTDLRAGSLIEGFRSESVDAIVELRDYLGRDVFNEFRATHPFPRLLGVCGVGMLAKAVFAP